MACCGANQVKMDYEVTFKDGTTAIAKSMPEARIMLAQDQTTGRPAGSMKAVPRKK